MPFIKLNTFLAWFPPLIVFRMFKQRGWHFTIDINKNKSKYRFRWISGFNAYFSTNERSPCFVNIWRFWVLDIVTFIIKDMLSFTSNLWLFEIYFFDYAQLQISAIVRLCPYWTWPLYLYKFYSLTWLKL